MESSRTGEIISDLKKYEPEKIILFGSAGRGDTDEHSDIDLVVIKETQKSFVERLAEVITYVRPSLYPVDIFVYTKDGTRMDLSTIPLKFELRETQCLFNTRGGL